jgi:hypothetical protein
MRYRSKVAALAAVVAVAACGDSGTNPGNGTGADDTAARFEQLADSVDGEGWSPTAEALRHAAKIVRLVGGATPVTLTIDGEARRFDAVAEQLDFPNIVCTWTDSTWCRRTAAWRRRRIQRWSRHRRTPPWYQATASSVVQSPTPRHPAVEGNVSRSGPGPCAR